MSGLKLSHRALSLGEEENIKQSFYVHLNWQKKSFVANKRHERFILTFPKKENKLAYVKGI